MKSKTIRFLSFLFPCLLACSVGHAVEQDNWFIETSIQGDYSENQLRAIAYYEGNSSENDRIFTSVDRSSSSKIMVLHVNGTFDRNITIAQTRRSVRDIALDANGTIFIAEDYAVTCIDNNGSFRWRTGKYGSISHYGSSGDGDGEFSSPNAIALGPNGRIYVADSSNHRVQVLDLNGSFHSKFGSNGSAPGQFSYPNDIAFFPDGKLAVADQNGIQVFDAEGVFLNFLPEGKYYCAIDQAGNVLTQKKSNSSYSVYCNQKGDILSTLERFIHRLEYGNGSVWSPSGTSVKVSFTPKGDILTSVHYSVGTGSGTFYGNFIQLKRRSFRTKGSPLPNTIPQPAIRNISQRTGTNIIDLDFEIIDSDDATATVGILAYAEGTRIVPQAWTDGTESKIGVPIATNQIHRASWDVKQDWTTNTGEIKFEILCQDANRTKPVDLHFLTLPLPDGNLTISKSPLKDSDYLNFFKYQVGIGSNEVAWDDSTDTWTNGSSTTYLNSSEGVTDDGREYLMSKLGYRYATSDEITNAKEAVTPGSVNEWTPPRPIQPRNLPKKVNEYGFDSGDHGTRAWWVVKE